jgi:hypothetical protein
MAKEGVKVNRTHLLSAQHGGPVERSATHDSSKPWSRTKSMARPSLGLERNQRPVRAPVSSAISALPEPQSQAQSTPRPSLGLEHNQRLARAPISTPGFPCMVIVLRTQRKPCLHPCCSRE